MAYAMSYWMCPISWWAVRKLSIVTFVHILILHKIGKFKMNLTEFHLIIIVELHVVLVAWILFPRLIYYWILSTYLLCPYVAVARYFIFNPSGQGWILFSCYKTSEANTVYVISKLGLKSNNEWIQAQGPRGTKKGITEHAINNLDLDQCAKVFQVESRETYIPGRAQC
jgi:hypothetical protein